MVDEAQRNTFALGEDPGGDLGDSLDEFLLAILTAVAPY